MKVAKTIVVLVSGPLVGILVGIVVGFLGSFLLLPPDNGTGRTPGDGFLIMFCLAISIVTFSGVGLALAIGIFLQEKTPKQQA